MSQFRKIKVMSQQSMVPFELDSLAKAREYQKWIYESVEPFLGRRILELGSGIGNLSQWLPARELLLLSEVDDHLISILKNKPEIQQKKNMSIMKLDLEKPLGDQVSQYQIDTVVSFNVMEHIENDVAAIRDHIHALKQSSSKGPKRLVVFVPAHNFAFGSFDRIFNHFRRYDAHMMKKIFREIDPSLKPELRYFNLLSLPGWIIQGKIFKKTVIKESQIRLLEKIIPFWKPVDYFLTRVLRLPLGQSLVCVVSIP